MLRKRLFIIISCFLFCLLSWSAGYPEAKNPQNGNFLKTVKELEYSVIQQQSMSLSQKPKDTAKQAQPVKKVTAADLKEESQLQRLSKKNNEINIALKEKERQAQDCLAKLNNFEKNNASMQSKIQKDLESKLEKARNENISLTQGLKDKTKEAGDLKKQLDDVNKLLKEKAELQTKVFDLNNSLLALKKEKAIIESILANQPQDLRLPLAAIPESDKTVNNKNINTNLGYSYGISGKIDEAIEQYRKALKYTPEDKDLHYNLAYLLAKKKRDREAVAEYKLALKGTPQDREVYYNLSIIYSVRLKDQKTAQEYYRKFLDLAPRSSELTPQKKSEKASKG
jgi:tetratricopeptide (TPR) repeat protein